MKIINPITVRTDLIYRGTGYEKQVIYTNVPEHANHGYWNPTITWLEGRLTVLRDIPDVGYNNNIYMAKRDNVNKYPPNNPDDWQFIKNYDVEWYNGSNTYVEGDQAVLADDWYGFHYLFECISETPITGTETGPLEWIWNAETSRYDPVVKAPNDYWEIVGTTVPYQAFDQKIGDDTLISQYGSIIYTIKPGRVYNSVALFNVKGATATVIMEDDTGILHEETKDITVNVTEVADWYSYFLGSGVEVIGDILFSDLPYSTYAELTIKIESSPNALVELGEIVIGSMQDLGITQYTPSFSIIDYSTKTTDFAGNYTILQRTFSKRMDIRVIIYTANINKIANTLIQLRTTPVIWIASDIDDYRNLLMIYGYYRDFDMIIPHRYWAEMNIQIEGLT